MGSCVAPCAYRRSSSHSQSRSSGRFAPASSGCSTSTVSETASTCRCRSSWHRVRTAADGDHQRPRAGDGVGPAGRRSRSACRSRCSGLLPSEAFADATRLAQQSCRCATRWRVPSGRALDVARLARRARRAHGYRLAAPRLSGRDARRGPPRRRRAREPARLGGGCAPRRPGRRADVARRARQHGAWGGAPPRRRGRPVAGGGVRRSSLGGRVGAIASIAEPGSGPPLPAARMYAVRQEISPMPLEAGEHEVVGRGRRHVPAGAGVSEAAVDRRPRAARRHGEPDGRRLELHRQRGADGRAHARALRGDGPALPVAAGRGRARQRPRCLGGRGRRQEPHVQRPHGHVVLRTASRGSRASAGSSPRHSSRTAASTGSASRT